MIQHVYERAAGAATLQRVVVATDDSRIQKAVAAFGGHVLMTSPQHGTGTDRVAEAARLLRLADDAVVVNIQGDEPLLQPEAVESVAAALCESPEFPMATLAHPSTDAAAFFDPSVVKVVIDLRARALYFSRAPIPAVRDGRAPLYYCKHLGLYAYRNAFLQRFTRLAPGHLENLERLEQLRALEHGYEILVVLTSFDALSVDTPEDLARVREILEQEQE
jgi:3-deoxy-manno-octulosonate cytidylyltransferase (CMP-KDO synthetase)